MEALEPA